LSAAATGECRLALTPANRPDSPLILGSGECPQFFLAGAISLDSKEAAIDGAATKTCHATQVTVATEGETGLGQATVAADICDHRVVGYTLCCLLVLIVLSICFCDGFFKVKPVSHSYQHSDRPVAYYHAIS